MFQGERKGKINKMSKYDIHAFVKTQLAYAEQMPSDAELFEHNAYGAVQWELYRANDQKLADKWETVYKPAFEKIIHNYWT